MSSIIEKTQSKEVSNYYGRVKVQETKKNRKRSKGLCPECGEDVHVAGGCPFCRWCGWSAC